MFSLTKNNGERYPRVLFAFFAAIIAVLYDVFFWQVQPGLGFFVFVAAYTLGLTFLAFATKHLHQPKALLLLIPIFILSFDVILYNNDFVHDLLLLCVAILLLVFSVTLTLKNPLKHQFSFSHIPVFRSIDLPFLQWSDLSRDLFSSKEDRQQAVYKQIAIGLLVSLPILFVFGALFVQADAVFSQLLTTMFGEPSTPWRILRTVCIFLLLSGLLYAVIHPSYLLGEKKISAFKIDNTIAVVVLSLVNILFLVFVCIQVGYLFGSYDFVIQNNITFAEYARSGFFQLAWVIALSALMLVVFYRSAVFHGSTALLKILKTIFILQVGVIALSALKRMNLYQDEFGYTVLRLYVEWFMYFAMVILALAAVSIGIDWKFRNFLYTSMVLGVTALCVVSSTNVDRAIARENVDRYINSGKELDMVYLLRELSIDAVPEVQRAFDSGFVYHDVRSDRNYTKDTFQQLYFEDAASLSHPRLRGNKTYASFSQITQSWKEFNFGVEKLKTL